MATIGLLAGDDPWEWSINRVIQELCHNQTPIWSRGGKSKPIPNLQQLEEALRENDVDGETLLELDKAALKDDLGLVSLGQRTAVMKAVEYLQQQSQGYLHAHPSPSYHQNVARWNSGFPATPLNTIYRDGDIKPSVEGTGSAFTPAHRHDEVMVDDSISNVPNPPQIVTKVHSSAYGKTLSPIAGSRDQNTDDPAIPIGLGIEQSVKPSEPWQIIGRRNVFERSNVHDARDMATPDAMTPNDHEPNDLTAALLANVDQELNKNQDHQHVPQIPARATATSTNTVVVKAKKRVVPFTIDHKDFYLSRNAIPVRDHMLPTSHEDLAARGTSFNTHEGFTFIQPKHNAGQRLIVHKTMKHTLRQQTIHLAGTKIRAIIRRPVPLLDGRLERFVTIYTPDQTPSLQSIGDWPALLAVADVKGSPAFGSQNPHPILRLTTHGNSDPFAVEPLQQEEAMQPGSAFDPGQFAYLLEKYPVQDSEHEELTAPGDQLSDEEVDEELWQEIERDRAEDAQMPKSTVMTKEQVHQAIDEAITDQIDNWFETKFVKVQLKGYRKWQKAVRERNRPAVLNDATFWKGHFETRLIKIRDAISKDVWHKAADVKNQCQSMEESVFQSEEYRYYISVLEADQAPQRPAQETLKKVPRSDRPVLAEGEEILESESEAVSDDDFIEHDSFPLPLDDIPYDDTSRADFVPIRDHATTPSTGEGPSTLSNGFIDHHNDVHQAELPGTPSFVADDEGDNSDDGILFAAARRKLSARKTARSEVESPRRRLIPQRNVSDTTISDRHSDSEKDSDLDGLPRLPTTVYRDKGRSKEQAIDLTFSSPRQHPSDGISSDFDVHTPELNPGNAQGEKTSIGFKDDPELPSLLETSSPSRLILSSPTDNSGLPHPEDVHDILALSWLAVSEDPRRALAKGVYALDINTAKDLTPFVSDTLKEQRQNSGRCRDVLMAGLAALGEGFAEGDGLDGIPPSRYGDCRIATQLFLDYACCREFLAESDISDAELHEAWSLSSRDAHASRFFNSLLHFLACLINYLQDTKTPNNSLSKAKKRKLDASIPSDKLEDDSDIIMLDSDDVHDIEQSARKKRKRKVQQSQEAAAQQHSDQDRVREQEQRRAAVEMRLKSMPLSAGNVVHAVNVDEPIVYLDPHIGRHVKPHQIQGIQFMWREIVTDPKHQGCLLAHTMGLGKTMQVISLLVAMGQCRESPDPDVRNHLPEHLMENKVMILAPPGLIDNWYDELLMWTPTNGPLGIVRKISAKKDYPQIESWAQEGGVLLLSYERFRTLLAPKNPTEIADLHHMEELLLETPSIIVADEAHKLKNVDSKLAKVAKRFRSRSRIALTGSPLNNHLEEYHQMIDWIAPGYLGDIVQFRSKYSEPIRDGLFVDSSAYERRMCLKKLHVLKKDLEPKISRADISAIAKDMPSKAEFFITVPLTDLQKEAYAIYVRYLLRSHNVGRGSSAQAQLWNWLSILSLLLNHPACFVNKVQEPTGSGNKAQAVSNVLSPYESDDNVPGDIPLEASDPLVEVMQNVAEVFHEQESLGTMDDSKLSHRTTLVKLILEESKSIGDKVLIFSHSIPSLNYLERMLTALNYRFLRLDGSVPMAKRQHITKAFNDEEGIHDVFLISTRAGGLGLNLQGANRVIIFDFSFNPSHEEQAIARAYRLGQKKTVFVYRFRAGGTYEDVVYNKATFKTQLFQRVVDKKNPMRHAQKSISDYLFPPKDVPLQDFEESRGKDPGVLDRIIEEVDCIRNIELTETFLKEDDETLTPEEIRAANEEYEDERLRRSDPAAYQKKLALQYQLTYNPQGWVGSQMPSSTQPGRAPTRATLPPSSSAPLANQHKQGRETKTPGSASKRVHDAVNSAMQNPRVPTPYAYVRDGDGILISGISSDSIGDGPTAEQRRVSFREPSLAAQHDRATDTRSNHSERNDQGVDGDCGPQ